MTENTFWIFWFKQCKVLAFVNNLLLNNDDCEVTAELVCTKISKGCGTPRVMTNPVGFVSSMNYPGEYDNNAHCKWDLTAPADKVIILEFVGRFSLESDQKGCSLDYVEVITF